ncbi:putative peptidase M14 [Paratrimastix pyriformis]|uniref:Peptidase M14 n=1 Tax=Paratrimastix pyriformis TaxID=342808 RepID=A0ABQ8UU80_9EUKA|nr:putative peptidase M14 [Paratrimastix pyriformis]
MDLSILTIPGHLPTHLPFKQVKSGFFNLSTVWSGEDPLADSLTRPLEIPCLVHNTQRDGPIVGITAAIHGDESNGCFVLANLFRELREGSIKIESGVLVGFPVVNIEGFLQATRLWRGKDLNREFLLSRRGFVAEYARRFLHSYVSQLDLLIDLHAVSRVHKSALHIRADLTDPVAVRMAHKLRVPIVVHQPSPAGSMRHAAFSEFGIHSVCIEVGSALTLAPDQTRQTVAGLAEFLGDLDRPTPVPGHPLSSRSPLICGGVNWVRSPCAGLPELICSPGEIIEPGQQLGKVYSLAGDCITKVIYPVSQRRGVVLSQLSAPGAVPQYELVRVGWLADPGAFAAPCSSWTRGRRTAAGKGAAR